MFSCKLAWSRRKALIVMIYAGVAVSILIAVATWLLLRGRERALVLAEKMAARVHEGEAELRKLNALIQAMLDSANFTVISTDTGGVISTFNAAAERMLGYRAEEVVGKTTPAIFHDAQEMMLHAEKLSRELGTPVAAGFEALIAKARLGQADENEWKYLRKDGSHFPVLLSVTALRGENGEITGYLGVGQNIEESKRARRQLMKLSRAMEQSPVSMLITDMSGAIEYVNPKFCQVSGYGVAELLGQNPSMFKSGKTPSATYRELWSTIRSGRQWQGELLNRKKNGELYWEHEVISGLRNEDGEIASYLVVKEDITKQKNAEHNIQRFKNILDNTLDMIFMFDPKTLRFVYANKGAVEMLGYEREELLKMHVWEIKPKLPEQVFRSLIAPLLNGDKPWLNYETLHRCKDGRDFPVEVFLQLIKEESDKCLFVAVSRDLTERRKVDTLKSEFISTVSHELRTPLTSIRGSLGLIRGGVTGELPTQAKPMIEIAYNNAERLVRLINDILDMEKIEAGKMHFDMHEVELMPLIEQALEANRSYGEQYRVRFTLAEGLPGARVNVDADRLSQVLANLLSNAAKFSPPDDDVIVTAKATGALVRVAVSDHGSGIPEEFRGRIFQKFSQADSSDTKKKGGTGLGLSITKAMIEKMGGVIGFDSALGQGTTFYIELPIADEPENSLLRGAFPLSPRVLICENDSEVAAQLREMMEQRGYHAVIADSAEAAKAMLADQHYQAMILDIGLQGQNGLSLVQELQADEQSAGLPILMISAKASAARDRLGDGVKVLDWLDKPLSPDKVFAALREHSANAIGLPVILHAEDDADIRQVVKTLIGEKGDVIAAPTLAAARKLLEERYFDLVILDIGLPDGSGLDLLTLVADKKPAVPVLIFSAQEIDSNLASAVDAALVKSRTSNQCLLDTIMAVIDRHEEGARDQVLGTSKNPVRGADIP